MDLRAQMYCGGNNKLFFYELFNIINQPDYNPSPIWERMENDDIILGELNLLDTIDTKILYTSMSIYMYFLEMVSL